MKICQRVILFSINSKSSLHGGVLQECMDIEEGGHIYAYNFDGSVHVNLLIHKHYLYSFQNSRVVWRCWPL